MSTDNNIPEPNSGSSPHAGNGADQPVAGLPVRADYPRSMSVGWPVAGAEWTEAAPAEGVITFSGLLHALRRRWPLATGLGLAVTTVVAGILWWLIPVNYEAVSLLQVKRSWYAPYTGKTQGSKSDKEFDIFKATQQARIKSQYVLRRALRKPEVQSFPMVKRERAPISWLASELDVSYPREGNLLRISLKGEIRDNVITLLEEVRKSYQEALFFETTEQRGKSLHALERRLEDESGELTRKREALHNLQKQLQALTSPGVQARMGRQQVRLSDLQRRQDRMVQEIQNSRRGIGVTARLRTSAQQIKFTGPQIEAYLTRNAAYYPEFMAANQAVAAQGQLQAMTSQSARDNTRAQARNAGQLFQAEMTRKTVIRKLRPVVERALRDELGGDDNQSQITLVALQTELKSLLIDYDQLTAQIQEQQSLVELIGGDNAKLGDLQYSVTQLEERFAMTQSEIDSVEADIEAKERVRVVQPAATVEGETDAWIKYTIVSLTSMASFGLVVFGIAIWDYQGKRVNTTTDVATGVGLRVVGSLPALNEHRFGGWPFGRRDQRWLKSVVDDSIDAIRTALMHGNGSSPTKVVMVTSATGQEGKTTVASQLAVSLARAGRRTLLIDGDMRNPRQHLVYGVPLDRGLSELLREEMDLDDVVQETAAAGLWIISAGLCDPRSIQALSRDPLHEIFQILRGRFDYIVIDSGPVLANADPLLIGQYADAAVVSVRRDVSQLPKIYEACERLRSVGIDVMGAVVNGTEPETRYYGSQVTHIESADDDEAVVEEPV